MDPYDQLKRYLPEGSIELLRPHLYQEPLQITLTRSRSTRLGDYRPPQNGKGYHRISVNGDLGPYSFLLTLLHELAHLKNWSSNGRNVKPHGPEWKAAYQKLITEFIEHRIFPDDLSRELNRVLPRLKATMSQNRDLKKCIDQLEGSEKSHTVERIPENEIFIYRGRHFIRLEKRRTRIKCLCKDNNRHYLFHPDTEIQARKQ